MNEVVQVLGSVSCVLVAFGLGWLFHEAQLKNKRRKMRHRRKVNAKRKARGLPALGVHTVPYAKKIQQRVAPWGPFPTTRKPAARPAKKSGHRLGLTADEWLEDTYDEEEATPELQELPADELAKWRGKVERKPYKPASTSEKREIMKALLDSHDDEAQE
jgi:hypothetical protein